MSLPEGRTAGVLPGPSWIEARLHGGSSRPLELGSQVLLQLESATLLPGLLAETGLRLETGIGANRYLLSAADAPGAVKAAATLAARPGVLASHPLRRQRVSLHGPYAPRPNDTLWARQWHLENRDTNTAERLGFDLNVRGAWPATRGEGVLLAQADDGMETDHPDLRVNTAGAPHFDFFKNQATGFHQSSAVAHGSAVAGLIAAQDDNARGVCGTAPGATLASWVAFNSNGSFLDEYKAGRMFGYASNLVAVQNHSWGNAYPELLEPYPEERVGISNAVTFGRGGKGVVMVRAAGNERRELNNANDDGYANDPRVVTVGAVRNDGRVTSYSTPGACVLVASFSADDRAQAPDGSYPAYPTVTTTDRRGSLGYNTGTGGSDPDYAYGTSGFEGTSASTPQISGLCALILGANPELTVRDVQQVLIQSARVLDPADPAVRANGAGLPVSHNTGFGVPDARQAVRLAGSWKNRPPLESTTVPRLQTLSVPDDGLRVEVAGDRLPVSLESIPAFPVDGLHVDDPMEAIPIVDVGSVTGPITNNVSGKAVLIRRRANAHAQQLLYAAQAGAVAAVFYNGSGLGERVFLNGMDVHFSTIPAVCIDQQAGLALREYLATTGEAMARINLLRVTYTLEVEPALLVEHVALRVRTSHQRRADLRITLVSPAGTRSVLQHFNDDQLSPLDDWTYTSVHHFYEASAGAWRVEVSDERPGVTGRVLAVDLTVEGVRITDSDRDGLDDAWEQSYFGDLAATASADPDHDGFSNSREQILDMDPLVSDTPLALSFDPWDSRHWRVSWPSIPGESYNLLEAAEATGEFTSVARIMATGRETEWIVPAAADQGRFFRVETSGSP